jgi:hypothetical protein
MISLWVETNDDFQTRVAAAQTVKAFQHQLFSGRYGLEQAAPGKLNVKLVGDGVQLLRQILDRGLKKKCIGRATFLSSSIDPFRNFRQRPGVGIETYEKPFRLAQGRPIYETPVARSDVDDDPALVRLNEPSEFFRVQLSTGATADSL